LVKTGTIWNKILNMPKVIITCPHCGFTFTTVHNISSGSNSCKKCKKKYYWKMKNGVITELRKG